MEPVLVEHKNDDYFITQKCVRCGHTKRNKLAREDNFDAAVAISKKNATK